MKRHHIERLLQKFDMGTQITFEHYLESWRDSLELPLTNFKGNSSKNILDTNPSTPSTSSYSRDSTPSRFVPYENKARSITPEDYISLANILNKNHKGLKLMEYYTEFNQFHEEQRNQIVALIANTYEEKGVKMSLAYSHNLEDEILDRFPTEKKVFLCANAYSRILLLSNFYF